MNRCLRLGLGWIVAWIWAWGLTRADDALRFRTGVLPVLTQAGCNAGSCHGAATGQGGFRLSLLGYDPEADHERITRELGGRRIQLAEPADSLLLRKAAGGLDHEGGRRLPTGSAGYDLLRRWVAAGAPYGPRELHVTGIEVEPTDLWLPAPDSSRQLRVTARLSDGSVSDVTARALYTSNDEAWIGVTPTGRLTVTGRGLASVMVRYSGQVAAVRVAVPLGDKPVQAADFPARNYVDTAIAAELVRLRVRPSPLSGEAEFLRRVHLDLTGRLPEEGAVREALAETSGIPGTAVRDQWIDALIDSEAFTDFWTLKLGDLLLLNGNGQPASTYHAWLRQQVAERVPLDQMVRSLLTASGELAREGPANFLTLASDPRDLGEQVSRMFLGAQLACARCHAHPTDRWTQEDAHRFAAYFARLTRDGGILRVADRGEVEHPKTGLPLAPKPLGTPAGEGNPAADRRVELAGWLTASDNPYFARTWANRIWRELMGRGLVEPVDDLRLTNPATHPALLDALAADLVANRFDLRHLVRTVVQSRTYQLTSRSEAGNALDTQLYSHARLKPLPAAVFADAVAQVTGVPDVFPGQSPGTRAVQLISPATPSAALDVLGRCQRRRACDSSAPAGGGLAQALHLLHGSTINDKLGKGIAVELQSQPATEVVERLFLRAFGRRPDPAERTAAVTWMEAAPERSTAVQDLLWALLNSREFALNH
jgi:hypothetical protein